MKLHKEGRMVLLVFLAMVVSLSALMFTVWPAGAWLVTLGLVIFYLLVLQFFRNPERPIPDFNNDLVYAPADGEVVVIEETEEAEYFQDKRVQISIFMSPLNVHVNRNPVGGEVKYCRYHPGKYLVAWHPKSSTDNERSTVVLNNGKWDILIRQIAGAMARRIRTYVEAGQQVTQGEDMGFITFGSRVDVFLPLDAKIRVKIGDKVKGNLDVLAEL